jgi:NADH-quinone oxidoreductase subunit F
MRVVIGQGSCGIATGAKKTAAEFEKLVEEKKLNIEIGITGCIGTCYLEPIVDVYDDKNNLTRYVKVSFDKVSEIVEKHLANGEVVTQMAISDTDKCFIDKQERVVLRKCGLIKTENIED